MSCQEIGQSACWCAKNSIACLSVAFVKWRLKNSSLGDGHLAGTTDCDYTAVLLSSRSHRDRILKMHIAFRYLALLGLIGLLIPSASGQSCVAAVKQPKKKTAGKGTATTKKQAAKKKRASKGAAPKPKSKLPSFNGSRKKIDMAPLDNSGRSAAKAHAAKIDRIIHSKLSREGVAPNRDSTDAQFIRRVYLDIAGRIPTAKEAQTFFRQAGTQKRERLIDRLLASPAYASNMYNYWGDILRLVDRVNNNVYTRPYSDWVKDSIRKNKPYDEWVREMLTASGKSWENPAVGYVLRDQGMPLDNLNNTVRVFLGTRIGCAQCHDHPFDRWTQKEFYQLAALTSGVLDRIPRRVQGGVTGIPTTISLDFKTIPNNTKTGRTARRLHRMNRMAVWESPYRKLKFPHDYAYEDAKPNQIVSPGVIFGTIPRLGPKASRRETFAKWMTSKDNPRFALTIANRLWKKNFGIGVIEPVDDMTDESDPSNKELMTSLENLMKELDFDTREFQRVIYLTEAYQRYSTIVDVDPEKPYFFQGPVIRRMTAEQVWDSLMTLAIPQPDTIVRQKDEAFQFSVVNLGKGTTQKQLMERAKRFDELQAKGRGQRNSRMYRDPKHIGDVGIELARASELPQPLPADHFLRQFGQSDRQIIQNNSTDGTVPQLLTMFNGPVTHMMLDSDSVVSKAVASEKSVDDAIDVIFLSILSRHAKRSEKLLAKREIQANGKSGAGDVAWALLNTREFLFVQ
jgi:hypothetical protein